MTTRDLFTDEELDQLRRFPDISREELIRYFTVTPAGGLDAGLGR